MKRIFLISMLLAFAGYGKAQKCEFSISPYSKCAPSMVTFTNVSGAITSITEMEWDFGDGTISAEDTAIHRYSVVHVYQTPGKYLVSP